MKKYGIFGGSFDPPHKSHFRIAQEFMNFANLDKIIIIPAWKHPTKKSDATDMQRLEMARIVFEKNPNFIVSNIEIEQNFSYTIDTLREIKKRLGDEVELSFLIGADNAESFDYWREPDEIKKMTKIYVAGRLGYAQRHEFKEIPSLKDEISSSSIRRDFKSNLQYIDPKVLDYIRKNRLYANKENFNNK